MKLMKQSSEIFWSSAAWSAWTSKSLGYRGASCDEVTVIFVIDIRVVTRRFPRELVAGGRLRGEVRIGRGSDAATAVHETGPTRAAHSPGIREIRTHRLAAARKEREPNHAQDRKLPGGARARALGGEHSHCEHVTRIASFPESSRAEAVNDMLAIERELTRLRGVSLSFRATRAFSLDVEGLRRWSTGSPNSA
jgi:hypothetical protein